MSAEPLACPYCNALVPLPPNARDGQRITCPRCGDAFPLRGVSGIQPPPGVTAAPTMVLPTMDLARSQPEPSWWLLDTYGQRLRALRAETRPAYLYFYPILPFVYIFLAMLAAVPPGCWHFALRHVAGVVVTGMALMAAGGLTFALLTQDQRRVNDSGFERKRKRPVFPEPPDEPAVLTVVPAKLATLGYLPSNANIVLGIHVRRLRQTPAGQALLKEEIKTGTGPVVLRSYLESWTGLNVEELDHLVLGVRTEDVESPQVVLVVRTVKPLDPRRVRFLKDAQKRPGPHKGQEVYVFQFPNSVIRPTLWFADEYTMVFALYGSLDDVPEKPRDGLDHLPWSVRNALNVRVDPGSILWLVSAIDDWKKMLEREWFKALQAFTRGLEPERLDHFKTIRLLAISVSLDPEAKAIAAIHCQDPSAAKKLRAAILGPEDAELPLGVKATLETEWLTVQWPGSLDAIIKTIGK